MSFWVFGCSSWETITMYIDSHSFQVLLILGKAWVTLHIIRPSGARNRHLKGFDESPWELQVSCLRRIIRTNNGQKNLRTCLIDRKLQSMLWIIIGFESWKLMRFFIWRESSWREVMYKESDYLWHDFYQKGTRASLMRGWESSHMSVYISLDCPP